MLNNIKDPAEIIPVFLFNYRSTPHSTTGVAPAELQLGRKIRTKLDLLMPSVENRVLDKQAKQRENYGGKNYEKFRPGTKIRFRNYSVKGPRWGNGEIVKQIGEVMYQIKTENGEMIKRHKNQIVPDLSENKSVCTSEFQETRTKEKNRNDNYEDYMWFNGPGERNQNVNVKETNVTNANVYAKCTANVNVKETNVNNANVHAKCTANVNVNNAKGNETIDNEKKLERPRRTIKQPRKLDL